MPEQGDFLRMTIVTELEGVAIRNDVHLEFIQGGTTDDLDDVAQLYGQEWIDVSNDVLTQEVTYVAFIVDNLSRNEVRGIRTSDLNGLILDGAHPQDQVLRFNEYGDSGGGDKLVRGAFNLSGTGQNLSENGRVADISIFQPIETFLGQQFLDSPSGLTLNPQVRRRIPGSDPPAYTFHRISSAQLNPTFFKLKSRKTSVLGL